MSVPPDNSRLLIREAGESDVPLIFSFVLELAEYERAAHEVVGTEPMLADALFGEDRVAEAVIAELDGEPAGFALFYRTFSTWQARPGMWLEDLYVTPERRRDGVGRALLEHLARLAVRRGCGRLEWSALTWNTPALRFYEKLGAEVLDEWQVHRLDGEALERFASGSGAPDG
jgi:GNAT superfamily N-acetyltransferase